LTRSCSFCGKTDLRGGAKGYCAGHYYQMRQGKTLTPIHKEWAKDWIARHLDHDGDDCLIWPYHRHNTSGAGTLQHEGRPVPAARYILVLAAGEPPTPEHQAAHSCGNAHLGCVNPKHLRWATPKENAADKIAHGTDPAGERNPQHLLTDDAVRTIRALAPVVGRRQLAEKFDVSYYTVWDVTAGRRWRHI
jgi:hypothetical protein